MQLNLFTNKLCDHCGRNPGPGKNPNLWNGFRDADTGELVCWSCRAKHYQVKAKHQGLTYSEIPTML